MTNMTSVWKQDRAIECVWPAQRAKTRVRLRRFMARFLRYYSLPSCAHHAGGPGGLIGTIEREYEAGRREMASKLSRIEVT